MMMVQRFKAYAYLPNFHFAWKGKSYGVGGKRNDCKLVFNGSKDGMV